MSQRREPKANKKLIADGVLGMLIFVFAEIMFFAGLISAFVVIKMEATTSWPPPGQPRLPVEHTAINTMALLISGVLLALAYRAFRRDPAKAKAKLMASIVLGTFFVGFQGMEWLSLIREGLTMTSSSLGSFFYTIVGAHALHAIAALCGMIWTWTRLRQGTLTASAFGTMQVFWYFVVLLWPFIYVQVYL